MPLPESQEIARLDLEIANLKSALWAYRYVREEVKGKQTAGARSPSVEKADRSRIKTAAADLATAARGIVAAEHALQMKMAQSE